MKNTNLLKVAMAQIAPIWLNKSQTTQKIEEYIIQAGQKKCDLVVFGETILSGYPFWLSITEASIFDSQIQKEINAHYIKNAIEIEKGDLKSICHLAKKHKIAIYLGIIERPNDRGGHSIYCSLVYINKEGEIKSVHRKLQPTFEERLSWAAGDGNGLKVHNLGNFKVGGLNCWENWMPLARTALYGLGENLHIAVWPGAIRNTEDITRFMAKEGRSFVISVSGLMRKEDFPKDTPHLDIILKNCPNILANGGSCIAAPNGEWVVSPYDNENNEKLIIAELDFNKVLEERQNFDAVGHYSRPDILKLTLNRKRQNNLDIIE